MLRSSLAAWRRGTRAAMFAQRAGRKRALRAWRAGVAAQQRDRMREWRLQQHANVARLRRTLRRWDKACQPTRADALKQRVAEKHATRRCCAQAVLRWRTVVAVSRMLAAAAAVDRRRLQRVGLAAWRAAMQLCRRSRALRALLQVRPAPRAPCSMHAPSAAPRALARALAPRDAMCCRA